MIHARPHRHLRRVHTKRGMEYRNINPEIPKRKVVFDKNTTNKQYKKKLKIVSPNTDADKDGVKNKDDCRPFDKSKQDDLDYEEMPDSNIKDSQQDYRSDPTYRAESGMNKGIEDEFNEGGW